jgi:hypothetical protein
MTRTFDVVHLEFALPRCIGKPRMSRYPLAREVLGPRLIRQRRGSRAVFRRRRWQCVAGRSVPLRRHFADDLRAGGLELQLKQIGDARRRFGVRANAERRNSGAREPHSNSVVFCEAILRLENHDARKLGQGGFYPLPDPDRDIFRRGVFEPIDIVQITMVEPFEQRFERGFDREEIGDKASDRIDRTLKPQFHAIGMPVKPAAPVPFGNIRQKVRRLETERLGDLHTPTFMECLGIYGFAD